MTRAASTQATGWPQDEQQADENREDQRKALHPELAASQNVEPIALAPQQGQFLDPAVHGQMLALDDQATRSAWRSGKRRA